MKRSKKLIHEQEKAGLLHDCLKKAGLSLKNGDVANELCKFIAFFFFSIFSAFCLQI